MPDLCDRKDKRAVFWITNSFGWAAACRISLEKALGRTLENEQSRDPFFRSVISGRRRDREFCDGHAHVDPRRLHRHSSTQNNGAHR